METGMTDKRQGRHTEHLRTKIAAGYILIFLLVGGIVHLWVDEWRKLETFETENHRINALRMEVHDVYVRVVELSLLGETVLEWEVADVEEYRDKRQAVDSLLCRFKNIYPAERIDSVRRLLEDKEKQLCGIMRVLDEQEDINERIAERVPVIAWKSTQEEPKKTKRKGLFGIFGKREKPEPTATTTMLYTLNRDMITQQKAQSRRLSDHADSLAARNAELIRKSGTAEIQHHAGSVLQASKRMIAMLNSLLSFFRLENGKERMNISPFRLQSITDVLEAEFRPMAESKDLKLIVENSTDVILMGDKERIMQIGDNLLSNAIKYTQAGSVSFHSGYDGKTLALIVEDTGSGMSEEEQQRVFGEFERLSNAATQDGFGLGLSIVKRIVDMMHGKIRLESEKGRGSRFTVEVPMNTADGISDEEKYKPERRFERSFSVIVLDDNDILLSMVRDMYAHCGIRCDACDNTGDLMEAVRTRNYDLLITDLKMPETNGYEVLELLRSSDIGNSKTIPVIVATASGSCTEEELLVHGFTACLFKPFDMAELIDVSEKCLLQKTDVEEYPDLSSLLAYGNKTAMLDRLITETEKDMQAMREAFGRLDRKALDEQVHRLRSSWAVIRADGPLWKLHELLHRDEKCSDEELRHSVNGVLRMGTAIIELARKEKKEEVR